MFANKQILKFFSILAIFVLIGTFYPAHETKAQVLGTGVTPTAEVPGPLLFFNGIISAVNLAMKSYDTILKPLAIAAAKAAIRTVVADLKNQTIRWIVTGQFGTPQFVSSFQADPRKIAENASRIFLSRITNINFCNYQPPAYSSNLLFSANLSITLECTFPQNLDFTKFRKDWRNGGWQALWAATDPQNNYWDVVNRAIVQKQIAENKSLAAWYNEILTNSGFTGLKKNGKTVTPGQYLADSLKETVHQDYPTLDQIDEWSGIIQAISEIVDAGLKQVISTGLDKAFK